MPSNSRPGKFFDPIRKNQSIAEIEDAQNQWDLLEAQEEANELARQRLEQERENAKMIATATRETEEKRQKHEEKMEKERQEHEKEMEFIRKESNDKDWKNKICNDYGINYNDILDFEILLNNDKGDLKQKFNNFRKEHYARDIEILFRRLDIHLETIHKEDIKKEGLNKDYIDYIYDVIMENDETINDMTDPYGSDPLLDKAVEYVIEMQMVNKYGLMSEFDIDYTRVENIIEQMKVRGIIDPNENVLFSKERWNEIMNSSN